MMVLYPNPCYIEKCYKGTVLNIQIFKILASLYAKQDDGSFVF